MRYRIFPAAAGALVACAAMFGSGCAPMTGASSLTLVSQDITRTSPEIEILGDKIQHDETLTWALVVFMFGSGGANHETAVDNALNQCDADLLVEAELKTITIGIPYIFMQFKSRVTGYPARFIEEGGN